MEKKAEFNLKCVTLEGLDWGKHILTPIGVTLCGMPTIDADKKKFTSLNDPIFNDIIFKYKVEKWDITCEKCLEMFDMFKVFAENERKNANTSPAHGDNKG